MPDNFSAPYYDLLRMDIPRPMWRAAGQICSISPPPNPGTREDNCTSMRTDRSPRCVSPLVWCWHERKALMEAMGWCSRPLQLVEKGMGQTCPKTWRLHYSKPGLGGAAYFQQGCHTMALCLQPSENPAKSTSAHNSASTLLRILHMGLTTLALVLESFHCCAQDTSLCSAGILFSYPSTSRVRDLMKYLLTTQPVMVSFATPLLTWSARR